MCTGRPSGKRKRSTLRLIQNKRRLVVWRRYLIGMALINSLSGCNKKSVPKDLQPTHAHNTSAERLVRLSHVQVQNAKIETVMLSQQSFAPRLPVYATLNADPKHLARVGPRMAGRITRINVSLGDKVRPGQVLLEMDTIEFHETSKDYLIALARAEETARAYERAKTTLREGVGTQSEHDRALANSSAAAANLREAEEHLHALGLSDEDIQKMRDRTSHGADHSHVRAPISGQITALDVSIGKVVSGTEDVITIADTKALWATLRIYERDISSVNIDAPMELRVTAYPDVPFQARLGFIANVVDPIARTVEARAQISNPDGRLRPGMTGRAWITLQKGQLSLNLPLEAVQKIEGANCVFIETGTTAQQTTYAIREIQISVDQGDVVSIVSGVKPGDRVVTRGALTLRGEWERSIQGES